jgi:hypothetical protein
MNRPCTSILLLASRHQSAGQLRVDMLTFTGMLSDIH